MRYKIRLDPNDNNREYTANQYMSFTFPREIIDLTSLSLFYDGMANIHRHITVGADTRSILRFFPKLSSGIIEELTILRDNQVIQYIQSYNYIDCLLNDLTTNDDSEVQRLKTDTIRKREIYYEGGNQTLINDPIIASVQRPGTLTTEWYDFIQNNVRVTNADTFFVSKFIGFLNMKYLDARNHDYTIRIKLAPTNILYNGIWFTGTAGITVNTTFSEAKYKVMNPYFMFDVMSELPSDGGESQTFMNYDVQYGNNDVNAKKVNLVAYTNDPLLYVMGTFINPWRSLVTNLQLAHFNDDTVQFGNRILATYTGFNQINEVYPLNDTYTAKQAMDTAELMILNNSVYFDRFGTAIQSASFKLNTYSLTPEMTIVDIFNQTKKYLKTDLKRITALCQFENNFFAHVAGIEDMSEDFKRIEWNVSHKLSYIGNASTTGGIPMLILCTVKKL